MQSLSLENPQEAVEGYRLSPQQKRLWLLQQNDVYVKCAVLIQGSINIELLKNALEKIVDRFEILRTTFKYFPGLNVPLQVIEDGGVIWNIAADFTEESLAEQQTNVAAIFEQFSYLNFELKECSTLYASLLILSPTQHILMLGLPTLCIDAIGMQNLVNELSRCYASTLKGEEITDEPLQYADIAEWENELLEAEDQELAKRYWLQQFSELETIKLPWERQVVPESLKSQPQLVSLPIQQDLQAAIANFVSRYKTSTANFVLTCWNILLYRLTGQTNLIIGTAFSGRKYKELNSVIGLLVKYLPINCSLTEDITFIELLKQIEQVNQSAYQWQEYYARESSNINALPFGFDFIELTEKYVVGNITFSIEQVVACVELFKVKVSCVQTAEALNLEFHYNANLFAVEDIQRLVAQFYKLLTSVVSKPNRAISKLEILSDREQHQLLVEFNQTQANYPHNKCFHQLFEAQVSRTPDNIAVVFENQQLTYAELNTRANQVAHYLRQLGVGAEVLVGICVERSLLMLVGLLGILKAGGAYVPLDPTYPQERLAFMLEDSKAPVLLTQQHLKESLPQHQARLICLDGDWEEIATSSPDNPHINVTFENLAYVIYTSGSTGKPKGTLIEHRGLVNYLCWCVQAYAVEQGEGAIAHSSISFDATITGLFAPLLVGGKVRLLPENLGIEALGATLQTSSNYSLIKITPAHLELLSQQILPQQAANLTKAFIIGGENLTAAQITFWQEFAPQTLLVNEYGPTETVVGCCVYRVPKQHLSGSVPIGRPIANTQLYILDQHLQPVPLGVAGELYIGGDGVGRGYLNQPQLTVEKFISNPFTPTTRLYKSGDLARYLPNGDIEYLGRIDDQVKIRGFRIELGEIETLLSQHPNIQTAVVVAREDAGDKRLVAYLVPVAEVINESELREFLAIQLPEYMLPTAFVVLKSLPLTANGKVDRQALPTPEVRPELAATFVAPRNEIEEAIAQIWAEVLKLKQIGIHDNFFALGGHSLLLTQVTSRLYQAFSIEVSLRQLFDTPTIAQLAAVISEKLLQQTDEATLAQMLAELE
jgi:amino acid adenylation domain-containing protein